MVTCKSKSANILRQMVYVPTSPSQREETRLNLNLLLTGECRTRRGTAMYGPAVVMALLQAQEISDSFHYSGFWLVCTRDVRDFDQQFGFNLEWGESIDSALACTCSQRTTTAPPPPVQTQTSTSNRELQAPPYQKIYCAISHNVARGT
jgi:hypothetical protein